MDAPDGKVKPCTRAAAHRLLLALAVEFASLRTLAKLRPEDGFAMLLRSLGLRDLRAHKIAHRALLSFRAFVTFRILVALVIRFLAFGVAFLFGALVALVRILALVAFVIERALLAFVTLIALVALLPLERLLVTVLPIHGALVAFVALRALRIVTFRSLRVVPLRALRVVPLRALR